jgi:hypothetical protein
MRRWWSCATIAPNLTKRVPGQDAVGPEVVVGPERLGYPEFNPLS